MVVQHGVVEVALDELGRGFTGHRAVIRSVPGVVLRLMTLGTIAGGESRRMDLGERLGGGVRGWVRCSQDPPADGQARGQHQEANAQSEPE